MKLTVVFEGQGIAENGGLFDVIVGKNEQGTLFYRPTDQGNFRPIDSYDLRLVNGEKYLVGTQPFAQEMPIT